MDQILRSEVILHKFKKGDFVLTHSGESAMLIIDDMLGKSNEGEHYYDGRYQCAWLDNNQDLQIGCFHEYDLIKTRSIIRF
jgi:uncharacterized protein YodC (DUF2158 family)